MEKDETKIHATYGATISFDLVPCESLKNWTKREIYAKLVTPFGFKESI